MSPRANHRPAVVVVEPIRARPVRGPRADGRWYWRAVVYQGQGGGERTLGTFWAHRAEVSPILVAQVAEHGLDRPSAPAGPQPITTVRDLVEEWYTRQLERPDRTTAPRTGLSKSARNNMRLSGSRICAAIGDVKLDRLDLDTLERYRDARLAEDYSTESVRGDLKWLGTAWLWGRARGHVPNRDLPRPKLEDVPVQNRRTPTRDDVIAVLRELDGWPRLAVYVLFATGARIGEVARLTWGDVDLGAALVRLRTTKTGKPRDVPLHPDVVAELRRWRSDGEVMDLGAGLFGVQPATVRWGTGDHLERACRAARVPPFTPHGLRRAAVDSMIDAGVSPKVAASITGHSVAVMWRFYASATEEQRTEAITRTGLGSLVELSSRGRKGDR